jgi:DNA replication protein DnaC
MLAPGPLRDAARTAIAPQTQEPHAALRTPAEPERVASCYGSYQITTNYLQDTPLATALGHIAVRRRIPTLMLRADAMFKRLKASRLDNSTEAEMRRLAGTRLLLIDDFALQPMDATATADFYELVVARHHKASTVLTSNRSPDEWLSIMTDPLLAQSAVDRITSTAHELIIEGQSYRRRQKPYG